MSLRSHWQTDWHEYFSLIVWYCVHSVCVRAVCVVLGTTRAKSTLLSIPKAFYYIAHKGIRPEILPERAATCIPAEEPQEAVASVWGHQSAQCETAALQPDLRPCRPAQPAAWEGDCAAALSPLAQSRCQGVRRGGR